ncbi:glycosyl transferase [Bacteroidia bacterium]|nr:glycosyl transferase [Bacteroidia bacterium]
MIKVFHIIHHFDLGGAERIAINIAKSSNPEFEYHLVEIEQTNSNFRREVLKEIELAGICYHCSPVKKTKLAILLFPFWFFGLYLKHKPHIIHTHTEIPDLSIWLFNMLTFLILLKTKYVRTIHNTVLWTDWKGIGKIIEPFFMRKGNNVSISKAVQNNYLVNYKAMTPIVYNGIQISPQQTFKTLVSNTKNVLFAGRFEYQKGIDQLIEIVQQLENDNRYYFHIVGSGSKENKVKEMLQNKRNVCIYNKIPNLSRYLASFDYLFMPSNFEGLALLPIEAGMSKTPPIINSCLGLDETLPQNWLLKVQNNSVEQYVHIFKEVLPMINYDKLANEAYNYAKENFTMEKMQQQYEAIYLNVLSCS